MTDKKKDSPVADGTGDTSNPGHNPGIAPTNPKDKKLEPSGMVTGRKEGAGEEFANLSQGGGEKVPADAWVVQKGRSISAAGGHKDEGQEITLQDFSGNNHPLATPEQHKAARQKAFDRLKQSGHIVKRSDYGKEPAPAGEQPKTDDSAKP